MQATFAEAKGKAPCILLIDEFDSFGNREKFSDTHRDYSVQVVNGLLESLDGVDGREGVVVVGTTNNAAMIDPAITRAGRFDLIVRIALPDLESLKAIFRQFLGPDLTHDDLSAAAVAARGGSGADCEAWVRRARDEARRSGAPLTLNGLIAAIRNGRGELPAEVRRRVAAHEAGHATVAVALGLGEPIALSVHDAGGFTETDLQPKALTAGDVIAGIAQLLAGREAERLIFGEVTAGSGGDGKSDLAKATCLAVAMEASFGLGSLGPLWLGPPDKLLGSLPHTQLGPKVRAVLHHAGAEARRALAENLAALERLAKALVEASYLDAAQIRVALGPIRTIKVRAVPGMSAKSSNANNSDAKRGEEDDASRKP